MENQPVNNTFESVLRNQRKGVMATELSDKLQSLTRAVMAVGKPGSITIKLKLMPASADGAALSVTDNIEIKLPEPPKANSIFYTTDEGQLVRENPEQRKLNFEVVTPLPVQPTAEPKNAVNQ